MCTAETENKSDSVEFHPSDKERIISRLCGFVREVWEAIDPNGAHSCDCFCYESRDRRPEHFLNEQTAIAFIETTVRKHLDAVRQERKQLLERIQEIEAGRTA